MEFKFPIRVYIEDTDAGGIVYYVNYLKFMERARTEFLRSIGQNHGDMLRDGNMFVITDTQIRFHKPAQLDDELWVSVGMADIKRASIAFGQTIVRQGTDELIASSQIRAAYVAKDSLKPSPMPSELRDTLAKYLLADN